MFCFCSNVNSGIYIRYATNPITSIGMKGGRVILFSSAKCVAFLMFC